MEYHYEVTPGPTIVKVYEGPVEEFSKARNAEAMEYLHGKVQDLRRQKLPSVREELMEGHPASAIVDLSRETEGSLIAMTTHGRSGVGRWVLGSVAARVVRHSESPVLVIPVAK